MDYIHNIGLRSVFNMTHAHGIGSGFALIVVLFILLVIIGASYVGHGY